MVGHRVLFTHESRIRLASNSTVSGGRVSTRQLSLWEQRAVCIISVPSDLRLYWGVFRPVKAEAVSVPALSLNHAGVHMCSQACCYMHAYQLLMSAAPLEVYAYQRFLKFMSPRLRTELCVSCWHSGGDRFKGKLTDDFHGCTTTNLSSRLGWRQ